MLNLLRSYMAYALEEAEKERNIGYKGRIHYRLGIIDDRKGYYKEAKDHFNVTYECVKAAKDTGGIILALNALGNIHKSLSEYKKSEVYLREAIEYNNIKSNYKFEWSLLYSLSSVLKEQFRYTEAFDAGYEAYRIAEEHKDSVDISKSLLLLGVLKTENSDHDEAIKLLKQSKKYVYQEENLYWKSLVNFNIATGFNFKEIADSSIYYGNESLVGFKKLGVTANIGSSYFVLASAYLKKGKFDKVISYADSAIAVLSDVQKDYYLNESRYAKAKVYDTLKQYDKIIEELDNIDLSDNKLSKLTKYKVANLYAKTYDKLGNYAKALEYAYDVIKYGSERDRITETKEIATIEARYNYQKEKSELEAEQLRKDLESQKEIARREVFILSAGILLIAGSIILFLVYRLYRNKRRDNLLLEQSNEEISHQATKLKELDIIKSRFFTNISHEFRTPLTLIKGPVDQLLKSDFNSSEQKLLETIKKNSDRLLTLINQILELSELQSRKKMLRLSEVDVELFSKRVVGAFESLADLRNIRLTYRIEKTNALAVFEEEAIEKVITNLLSNAFKFTADGGTIEVKVSHQNDELKFQVKDSGIGIDETELKNIFEMFYYTESDQSASSGIGLALINELIKNHHGSIDVESQKNEGTTFMIVIPSSLAYYENKELVYEFDTSERKPNENSKTESPIEVEQSNYTNDSTKATVLVVEDNDEIRSYMNNILQDRFNIIDAPNGKIGVEKAIESIPDVIVSDVMMPEMDGFEAAKILKSDERTSHIPLILLTAKGDKESKLEGLSLQIDDYLLKPFDQDELLIRIDNMVKNRKLLQQKFSADFINNPEQIDLPSIDQQFIAKVRAVVEERIDDTELTVDELAKEVGVSRSQLHRKIVGLSGKSTSLFIRNIRLHRAYQLLEKRIGNISEVSDQVGFNSPSYFNKCFKEEYGVTPKQVMNGELKES